MNLDCKICGKGFLSLKGLHSHISKAHSKTTQEYYHEYWPRHDLFTKELISYKNYEQYFEDNFNKNENILKYLNTLNENLKEQFCFSLIAKISTKQKQMKNNFGLSCVELKTLNLPNICDFERILRKSYNDILEECGSESKYVHYDKSILKRKNIKDFSILIDTREQNPLSFKNKDVKNHKLDFGDYSANKEHFENVFVERKSINDLCSTLSGGFERFQREIKRAENFNAYLIVIVEDEFNNLKQINESKKTKATKEFICHQMRVLCRQNQNVQFVFSGSREKSQDLIVKFLSLGKICKIVDLQYHLEKGSFNYVV